MSRRSERETQDRVVALLQTMGYRYLGNLMDQSSSNIREDDLKDWLTARGEYTPDVVTRAVTQFTREASMGSNDDLYETNKEVYQRLRYGVNVALQNEPNVTVRLIDWKNPEANDFAVAEEVTVHSESTKRPDIVLYVNGIALGVMELKRAGVNISDAIRQNLSNQESRFIAPFFSTMQLVIAGNDSQGLKYGTILTKEGFFLSWKEDGVTIDPRENRLDQQVGLMFEKERFLDIVHNFVVFDAGVKKLCRPNQYFGVKHAQERVAKKEGGIIWHTQGSGKSLTMVWLAKWIRENQEDARVLILTDRTELDEQIEKVFGSVDEQIHRTRNGRDLLRVLGENAPWLMCSLIHKFGGQDGEGQSEFIEVLDHADDFAPQGNLFVFIDECHRTQSGELHSAMKALIPDAMFIGFTGTPLLQKDKKKSVEVFGSYIHTYKFNEAVADGVVLDLLYEARDAEQKVVDQQGIDDWFATVTAGMNDLPKAQLKKQWGNMQKMLSSSERLDRIAFDVIKDFRVKPRLKDGRGNAMLVANSIYEACRYYKIFQEKGFTKCAVVTSYEPIVQSLRLESTGHGETMAQEQFAIYEKMLDGRSREDFELAVKKQFIESPGEMQLLIVVDKLLTGFDAPACTYLYIDKRMRDHGLFQAICRVNRTEKADKDFGYIVDYMGLFNQLSASIDDYTAEAFDGYEEEDIDGLLKDRLKVAKERLDDSLEAVEQLCAKVEPPKEVEQYIHHFCGDIANPDDLKGREPKRQALYQAVVALIRAYNNVGGEMKQAGYSDAESNRIKGRVLFFTEQRDAIKHASGDYIDLKRYEPDMRLLLDQYLAADPARILSSLGDQTLLAILAAQGAEEAANALPQGVRNNRNAVAESIAGNVRRVITTEMPINPVFYGKMSALLTDLVQKRREDVLSYEDFLKELEQMAKQMASTQARSYPDGIETGAQQALYDALEDKDLALSVDGAVFMAMEDSWLGNTMKERKVKRALNERIKDSEKADEVFDLVKHQKEYRT